MNEALHDLVREWVDKAESGWKIAQHDMQTDDPTPDMVCFHMQQCVEKYLKAFLTLYQVSFWRTHDIAESIERCAEVDAGFRSLYQTGADSLSVYGVEIRYPSFADKPSLEEAQCALQIAEQVRAFVRLRLAQYGYEE